MKNYKQILEAMLSESSGPKDNPYWGDATPVARVGIGKDGPKLMLTTRGEIKASRDEAAELEQIISNAKRPKPGELVPLNRFDADGKLLPPRQKPKPSGPPSRQKEIPSWMNQTPPTSPNSGQDIGRIRLPTPISTPPTPASPGQREAEIGTPPKKKPGKRLPIYGPPDSKNPYAPPPIINFPEIRYQGSRPPDSKNPFLPRPRLDAPEIRTGWRPTTDPFGEVDIGPGTGVFRGVDGGPSRGAFRGVDVSTGKEVRGPSDSWSPEKETMIQRYDEKGRPIGNYRPEIMIQRYDEKGRPIGNYRNEIAIKWDEGRPIRDPYNMPVQK